MRFDHQYQHLDKFPLPCEHFPRVFKSPLITKVLEEAQLITQAPEPMVYLTAISYVSLALQGILNVEMPMGKIRPVSIMSLIIAESGERKSSLENILSKGVKSFQKDTLKNHEAQLRRYKLKLDIHQQKTATIKKSINLNEQRQCEEILDRLLEHAECQPNKPKLPLLVFEDSTPEAFLSALTENRPNAFLGSSEGGIFWDSRFASSTPIINALYSGDDVTVNRKSSESFTLVEGRLIVLIMTQWCALERYLKNTKDNVRGNGFLSRFFVCAPLSKCGFRQTNGVKHSQKGLQAFNDRIYQLLSESAELEDYTARKIVRFSADAKDIWFDVYNDIEYKMRPNGMYEHVKDHASKLPENIARLAALIHCFDNSFNEDISAETLKEAINLVSYFSGQFMNVFCAQPKYVTDAHNLMQWFITYTNSGVRYLKRNNILQFGPIGTRKKTDLDAALNYLKPNNNLVELRSRKTRVIDLMPQYIYDEAKLKQDLSQDMVFFS